MAKFQDILRSVFYIVLIIAFTQPFIATLKRAYQKTIEPHTKVGYLEITGMLADSTSYIKQCKHVFKDPDVKAILIKIDAAGGIAGTSETIFHEIMELKKEYPKQIVVWVEKLCTSGAYWVACSADHIIASPVAWVGNIGAYIPFRFKLKEFINDHKIRYESPKAGIYKNFTDPFVDTTPEQAVMLQELVNQTYQEFTQSVASRRGKLSLSTIQQWANGKVFTGRQALEIGLIDEVGSKSNAIAWIREKALIEGKIEWVKPPKPSAWSSYFSAPQQTEEVETSLVGKITDVVCTRLEQRYLNQMAMPTV